MKKKIGILVPFIFVVAIAFPISCSLSGCSSEATRKSTEISEQADNFETTRRLTVINTRNDKIILEFTGTFSILSSSGDIDILCAIGDNRYEKHFFRLNDWTIYVVEDVSNQGVDKYFREIKYYPENN